MDLCPEIEEYTMTDESFKLPGSSYEEISKIIQEYSKLTRASSLDDVAQIVKMHVTAISRNNSFLSSIGIIEGEKLKNSTDIGKKLGRAMEYDNAYEISSTWREIVKANEFLSKMLSAIKIRRSMDTATFQSHIAYSAGKSKTTNTMAGAKAIIDLLLKAELIKEKDGQLFTTDYSNENYESTQTNQEQKFQEKTILDQNKKNLIQFPTESKNVSINIQINLEVKPEELDGLGVRIKQLIKEISKPLEDTENKITS